MSARAAADAADAEVLAQVPYLAQVVAGLDAAVDEALAVRCAALGPQQLAALLRQLCRVRSRLDAAVLRCVKAVDDRDDVVPTARPGTAAAAFLQHSLGLEGRQARREADAARLLDPDTGDLPRLGAAHAAGQVSGGHVQVAVRLHHRLPASVREALIPVVDPVTGEQREARCLDVIDAMLAGQAPGLSVPAFGRVADRLREHLNPPGPDTADQRRYLQLTSLPDGSLLGRFACGPAQAVALTTVIAAGAGPQPGTAIDQHGIEQRIPDPRPPAPAGWTP